MGVNEWTCCICDVKLSEKYHIDGNDYCQEHARNIPRLPSVFDEFVRGTVIGGDSAVRYQFWRDDRKLAECEAENDRSAIEWFKMKHPEQFAQGAEMRAFDI